MSESFIEFIQHAQSLVEHRSVHLFKQSESYFTKLRKQDSSIELCIQLLQFSSLPLTGMNIPIETVHLIASQTLSYACSSKRLNPSTILMLVHLVVQFAPSKDGHDNSNMKSVTYKHLKLALCQAILNDIIVSAISNPGDNAAFDPTIFSLELYYNNLSAALTDSSSLTLDLSIWTEILTNIPEQITSKEFVRFSKPFFSFPSALSQELFSHHLYHINLPYLVRLAHANLRHLVSSGQLLVLPHTAASSSVSSTGDTSSRNGEAGSVMVPYHSCRFSELLECVRAWGEGYLRIVATYVPDSAEACRLRHNLFLLLVSSSADSHSGPGLQYGEPAAETHSVSLMELVTGYLRTTCQFSTTTEFMSESSRQCGDKSSAHYSVTLEQCQDLLRVLALSVFGFWNYNKDALESALMPIAVLRVLSIPDEANTIPTASSSSLLSSSPSPSLYTTGCAVVGCVLPLLRALLRDCRVRMQVNPLAEEAQDQSAIIHALTTVSDALTPLLPWITLALGQQANESTTLPPTTDGSCDQRNISTSECLYLFSALLSDLVELLSAYLELVAVEFAPLLLGQTEDFDAEMYESYVDTVSAPTDIVSSIINGFVHYTSAVTLLAGSTDMSRINTEFTSQIVESSCNLIQLLVRVSVLPACLQQPNQQHLQLFVTSASAFSLIHEKFNVYRNDIRDFIRELYQSCHAGSNPFVPFIVQNTVSALDGYITAAEQGHQNYDMLVLQLESQLHLCTSISRGLCTEMTSATTASSTTSSTVLDTVSKLLHLVSHRVCVSVASLARLVAVLIGDILLTYYDCSRRLSVSHVTMSSITNSAAGVCTEQMSVADVCVQCVTAALFSLRYTESVTDETKQLYTYISECVSKAQIQAPSASPVLIQLLPFRIKQDHIGAVAVLKIVDLFVTLLNNETSALVSSDTVSIAARVIGDETEDLVENFPVLKLFQFLSESKWTILSSSNYFWEPPISSRVMTFKSFLLLHEASLTASSRGLAVLQCVSDPQTDSSLSTSHLIGTQLGPLCVALVTALCLSAPHPESQTPEQLRAYDELLLRTLDVFFPIASNPSAPALRQKCVQQGLELIVSMCPSLAAAVLSGGYTSLLNLATTDITIMARITALVAGNVPLMALIRVTELIAQGLDIICSSSTRQWRQCSDAMLAARLQISFCQIYYRTARHVWLPLAQQLLSYCCSSHRADTRAVLMSPICSLMEKLIGGLTPIPGLSQSTGVDSADLVDLLSNSLPTLSLSLVTSQLWLSPECIRVASSVINVLLKWTACGVDLSGVVSQYFDRVSALLSAALMQLPSPHPGDSAPDTTMLAQTDLIFAHAADFWTVCTTHTRLLYTCPTPSLNSTVSLNAPVNASVPIACFREYSHLIATAAEALGGYSVRRAYLLSFGARAMDEGEAALEDLGAWEKMVALFASFASRPVLEGLPPTEEMLFTQYLKGTFESPRLSHMLRTIIFALCGCLPSTHREGLIFALYSLFQLFTPDAAALTLLPVMTDESAMWLYQNTVSSENSRQSLAQQLRMHATLGNAKQFKTSLKILGRKR